ncbi:hypothetical protein F5Y09DRAFT_24865 [Xylaria sp. FL1042]|nr:hypothetical protein F5Y09DRAFT_24865 [Xylaria sp. FL1042]
MCRIWPSWARGLEENHSRRLCLFRALAIKQLRHLCRWTELLRLGLLQQPLKPGLISPASVKCFVFGNGLPFVPNFPINYFQIRALGLVPLFVSTSANYFFTIAPAISVISFASRLRSHHVVLGTTYPPMRQINGISWAGLRVIRPITTGCCSTSRRKHKLSKTRMKR